MEVIETTGTVITDLSPESVIQVEQLPLIKERMQEVNRSVMDSVAVALAMECTEESYKQVKSARASLKKEFDAWETRRKEVKAEIVKPYEDFNREYEANIGRPYKEADAALAEKIGKVETGLKQQKADKAQSYCYELMKSMGVGTDVVNFGQLGIRIGMSDSVKKLQEQVAEKIGQIAADLDVISKLPDAAEILVEYKRDRNLARAQTVVMERKKAIQEAEEQQRRDAAARAEQQRRELEAKLAAQQTAPAPATVEAPTEEPSPVQPEAPAVDEKRVNLTFRVNGPMTQMLAFRDMLKKYCEDAGLNITGLKKIKPEDRKDGETYYG